METTPNNTGKSSSSEIDNLYELIELAEKTSDKIQSLEKEVSGARERLVFNASLISLLLATFFSIGHGSIDSKKSLLLVLVVLVAFFSYSIPKIRMLRQWRRDLTIEVSVVGDLVKIISGLVESYGDKIDIVKISLIKLKLCRVRFSTDTLDKGFLFR